MKKNLLALIVLLLILFLHGAAQADMGAIVTRSVSLSEPSSLEVNEFAFIEILRPEITHKVAVLAIKKNMIAHHVVFLEIFDYCVQHFSCGSTVLELRVNPDYVNPSALRDIEVPASYVSQAE